MCLAWGESVYGTGRRTVQKGVKLHLMAEPAFILHHRSPPMFVYRRPSTLSALKGLQTCLHLITTLGRKFQTLCESGYSKLSVQKHAPFARKSFMLSHPIFAYLPRRNCIRRCSRWTSIVFQGVWRYVCIDRTLLNRRQVSLRGSPVNDIASFQSLPAFGYSAAVC
jgi:hypothetical protein